MRHSRQREQRYRRTAGNHRRHHRRRNHLRPHHGRIPDAFRACHPGLRLSAARRALFRRELEELLLLAREKRPERHDVQRFLRRRHRSAAVPALQLSPLRRRFRWRRPVDLSGQSGRCHRQRRPLPAASTAGARTAESPLRAKAAPEAIAALADGDVRRDTRSRDLAQHGVVATSAPTTEDETVALIDLVTPDRADRILARLRELLRADALQPEQLLRHGGVPPGRGALARSAARSRLGAVSRRELPASRTGCRGTLHAVAGCGATAPGPRAGSGAPVRG